jgi:integrase
MRGSTIKRGSTWTAYWSTTDSATGKRRQHSKGGFRTQAEAQMQLNRVLPKVDDGSFRPDHPLTVKQLLVDHWLPAQKSRQLRPATLAQYGAVVDHWIIPRIGEVRVAGLTPAVVDEMVEGMRTETSARGRKGLSARSTQLAVGVLKSACTWAVNNELMGRNPLSGVQRPKVVGTPMKSWTEDQARRFLSATKSDRLGFAWALLLTRGLRRGELCGLRWADVDLDGGVLVVNRTRVVVDGKTIDSSPKTAAGRRPVPLDSSLVGILKSHKARQARERLGAGEAYRDGDYLLSNELGAAYHPDSVSQWFDDAVKASGLPRIRLHDTRHTAASLMLAAGTPTKVVSDLLGHASPTITLAIYAHTLPGMAEEAGERLSGRLLG